MDWEIILVQEVHEWLEALARTDPTSVNAVAAAIDQLSIYGPDLGRPLVDSISNSRIGNLKELRPGSSARTEIRLLFVFDPQRQAVLLVAGDKAGAWKRWYQENIHFAERRYEKWLLGGYDEEI